MPDPAKQLVEELGSFLDEATILAISSDFDLTKPDDLDAARKILLAISENVEKEEATGFNSGGFGGNDPAFTLNLDEGDGSDVPPPMTDGNFGSLDGQPPTTEDSHSPGVLSGSLSEGSAQENPEIIHVSILDNLSDEDKVSQLAAMFVSLKPIDVKLALQKAKGDADIAMDELLNLQWLEQTGQRPRGIDGFYISDDEIPRVPRRKKKGPKNVGKAPKVSVSKSDDTSISLEEPFRDEAADGKNINFLSERLAISNSDATSIYQRNKYSLGAAIVNVLDNFRALGLENSSDPRRTLLKKEQEKRVSWIPQCYFDAVFDMTATSPSHYATDIIDVLAGYFDKPSYIKYNISYSTVPSDLELYSDSPLPASPTVRRASLQDSSTPTAHKSHTAQQLRAPPASPMARRSSWQDNSTPYTLKSYTVQQLRAPPTSYQAASSAKATLAASTQHSFASASSAFRKGKSDPLMRQAASYYADRARSEAATHRQAITTEAQFLVDQNSTKDMIDLHGVTVHDGVQIALDRAWRWWDNLGEEKARKASRDGLKIVTGQGRHSADGKSPLRINVFKALVADGWKLEVLTGAYLVTGRR